MFIFDEEMVRSKTFIIMTGNTVLRERDHFLKNIYFQHNKK